MTMKLAKTCFIAALAAVVVASVAHGDDCNLDKVDPFVGTGGNGHTTPAAAYPFGMVQPGPDTGHEGWERCSAYQYGDKAIKRFSQNHLSGTGCSEFGDLGFMPSADDPEEALERDYSAGFEKKNEKTSPGYYAVTLDCGTKVEATCTRHVSLFRFTFPKGKPASLLFDPSWSFDKTKSVQVSPMKKRRVSGHVDRDGWPGHEADAKFFFDRSRAWTNCFDAATGFMRAKDSKGAWREPFDPYAIDGKGLHNYTEGNAFHWNWHVMQEPNLLVEMLGGRSAALKRLEGLFSEDSTRNDGELSDVTGLIGQYCQGNEPCHHAIYFFTLMGRRDLAAKYIGEVMDTQYYPSPTGLCGNEDCGQMSAWYVFSAMGFYPSDPCGGEYVLGEPQLDEIKLRVGNEGVGEFRIVRNVKLWNCENMKLCNYENGNTNNPAIAHLNGKKVDGGVIRHEDIMKGGTLAFAGGSEKYNYVVDSSAAPELDQWMRTKMLPAVRKWYPKLVEMFPSEGWEASKTITLNFDAREEDVPPAYTVGNVVTFGRKWIKGNPGDVGCGIHEIFHVVQDDYPDEKTFWLQEGIADYVR